MSGDDAKTVKVWRWEDAPDELRRLSRHGGDEDWVALVPRSVADSWEWTPTWIDTLGSCDVQKSVRRDGARVYIGAHA
jgi:hypothetical protein